MEEQSRIDQTIEHAKEYVETKWDLIILNTTEKVSNAASSIATSLILILVMSFVLLFSSIGVAWYIGEQNGSASMGFLIVAGFYLIVAVLFYFMRNEWLKIPIINSILKKLHYDNED